MSNKKTHGWQVGIQRIADGRYDDPMALSAVYEQEEAEKAVGVIGWTVEEAIDAAEGLWMCTINEYALGILRKEGGFLGVWGEYRVDIDAGDVFGDDAVVLLPRGGGHTCADNPTLPCANKECEAEARELNGLPSVEEEHEEHVREMRKGGAPADGCRLCREEMRANSRIGWSDPYEQKEHD